MSKNVTKITQNWDLEVVKTDSFCFANRASESNLSN